MNTVIDFYLDFSSPYGYLAAMKIEALASKYQRRVCWHPILLGAIFKTTGAQPLPNVPLKGDYAARDFARSARYLGLPFRLPSQFPIPTVTAVRAFYWLQTRDPLRAVDLAKALLHSYFVDDINISQLDGVIQVARTLGIDPDALTAGVNDEAVKAITKQEVETAIARGVFGSPYVIIDGEPFWGADRLEQIAQWLATGGF